MEKYLQSCKTEFWKEVFKAELDYILIQVILVVQKTLGPCYKNNVDQYVI